MYKPKDSHYAASENTEIIGNSLPFIFAKILYIERIKTLNFHTYRLKLVFRALFVIDAISVANSFTYMIFFSDA